MGVFYGFIHRGDPRSLLNRPSWEPILQVNFHHQDEGTEPTLHTEGNVTWRDFFLFFSEGNAPPKECKVYMYIYI